MTMQIIKWNPMREVAHMHDEIMREWLQAARRTTGGAAFAPPTDVIESDGTITLHLDLPGVALEDVHVEWHEGVLAVTGERPRPEVEGAWQRMERPYGPFARSVRLPDDIESGRITATMDRGVLTIEIPRAERPRPTRIEVTEVIEQADSGEDA